MFTEYKTTRAKKSPEDLASAKDWQPKARRLYIPLNLKDYGMNVVEGEKNGKKTHSITWKSKPYCKLLLNNKQNAQDFAMLEINTDAGLAVQIDPANHKRCYISIPKGALKSFPKDNSMLKYKINGEKITISRK